MTDLPPNSEDPGTEPGLDLGAPPPRETGYRVLARKYRPQNFEDLIGQEAMVKTLKNAFASGRIAHAFMLTGVRGVGKTTTARIIARALNYVGPNGEEGPTIDMPVPGVHCEAIAESRHPDVMEMDAASRTGINDIREIVEGVRYGPVSARYKVYIIDEVHMLSTQAFNGLLKTLEEPPPHVKFIFATTEVRKVPVTVLSRCQRFDLRRIEASELVGLMTKILAKEGAAAEEGALRLIARAAEGSARDALSILDQALAQGPGEISESAVRDMLGLADRTRTVELLKHILAGAPARALELMDEQLKLGADPLAVLQDLTALIHQATKAKVVGGEVDAGLPEAERQEMAEIAGKTSVSHLSRAWQLLLKGIGEVQTSGDAAAAAEMVLIRLAHVADLPSPEELVRRLEGGAVAAPRPAPSAASAPSPERPSRAPTPSGGGRASAQPRRQSEPEPDMVAQPTMAAAPGVRLETLEDFVAEAEKRRELGLAREIKVDVHPVSFAPGRFEFQPGPHAAQDLAGRIRRALQEWTGETWMVSVATGGGQQTVRARRKDEEMRRRAEAEADPLVKEVMAKFPGARIVDVREAPQPIETAEAAEEAEEPEEISEGDES